MRRRAKTPAHSPLMPEGTPGHPWWGCYVERRTRGSQYSESQLPSAGRPRAQMAFIWACCAAVSWMTFLGLQFQMPCVGPVSFLS